MRNESGQAEPGAVGVLIGFVLVLLVLFGLGWWLTLGMRTEVVGTGEAALVYNSGPIEGQGKFREHVGPNSGRVETGWFSDVYHYPLTQRDYIISEREGEGDGGRSHITAPSKDSIDVSYEIAVYFRINEDKLRKFHENIGKKHEAYNDEGWDLMLSKVFRQQVEASVQEQSRKYNAVALYSDADVKEQIEAAIAAELADRINNVVGDTYFCGVSEDKCGDFKFVLKKVDLPQSTKDALKANKDSLIAVETKQNEVAQKRAEAQALAEFKRVVETCGQPCVMKHAIDSGKITFWVLPAGAPMVMPSPR